MQEHVGLVKREMPKAKAKAKQTLKAPKPRTKLDRYAYLPTDLQRAAVFMARSDFLRKLQKDQHDRGRRHVATQGPPPISVDKDLQEKIAALNAEIETLRGRPPQPYRKTCAPSSAPTPSTAVPGSRVAFGGSSASRTPFTVPMDDDS